MRGKLVAVVATGVLSALGLGPVPSPEASALTCPDPGYTPCEPASMTVDGQHRVTETQRAVYRVRVRPFSGLGKVRGTLTITVRPGPAAVVIRHVSSTRVRHPRLPALDPARYHVHFHFEPRGVMGPADATRPLVVKAERG